MTLSFTPKFLPFQMAARLRTLQQGSLAIGNTKQNVANLLTLATAEANSPTTGWAKWRKGNSTAKIQSNLLICARLAPGYIAPAGTGYANVSTGTPGVFTVTTAAAAHNYAGTWTDSGGNVAVGQPATGWDSVGNNLGTISPAAPKLLDGSTAVAALITGSGFSGLALIVPGSLSQSVFTTLTITVNNVAATQVALASAIASYRQNSGYTGWYWSAAQCSAHGWTSTPNGNGGMFSPLVAYPVVLT